MPDECLSGGPVESYFSVHDQDSDDGPRDACGLFGVYAIDEEIDVARTLYFGIFALQHRGQESAGICVAAADDLICRKEDGLVAQVFDEESLATLQGRHGIGHVRYSTRRSGVVEPPQPALGRTSRGPFAVAHNGALVNSADLRAELARGGGTAPMDSDAEIIARLIEECGDVDIEEALAQVVRRIEGAYCLAVLTLDRVLGLRDPNGVRPLCVGQWKSSAHLLASETCALNVAGGSLIREIAPGEMAVLDSDGIRFVQLVPEDRPAMCLFEFIYFSRPDSRIYDRNLHMARRRLGNLLALECPATADVVVGVPDTGTPAAIGYAEASRIPYGEGLIKNRYIHRTFIQPDARLRELGVRMKLTVLRDTVNGKRIVVVEDSIVRGTTTRTIVQMMRDAGAAEVHLRITAPPYKFPCFYGIDTAGRSELAASNRSEEEICSELGADSIGFLSLAQVMKAIRLRKDNFCRACFDKQYPVPIPEPLRAEKFDLGTGKGG